MIKLEKVTKSFGEHNVLDNLYLSFDKGSRTAIMGPSGSGKTTLFMILAGIISPDSGKICGTEGLRFSAVFQDDRLCENLSLYANIKLVTPKNVSKSDILSAIRELGLDGYENKPVSTLSGGMKRRASVIRAILAEFDVIVLDEPFNGLDTDTRAATAKYILDRLDNRTLIMITHNPEDVKLLGCETVHLDK